MLTADLTVTATGSSTKPGTATAKTFALVASVLNGNTKRRIAATASTTPQELSVSHSLSGSGVLQRARSLVRFDYTANNVDPQLYGGKAPTAAAYFVLDRPLNQGAVITDTIIKDLIGQLIDALCVAGQLDKLLNLES